MSARIDYVLPLRWESDEESEDLTTYLRWLAQHARIIVVDGSPAPLFDRHAEQWQGLVHHVRPREDGSLNGKVSGVRTGMALATAERVVIADDDVRYDQQSLLRTVDLLDQADLVGPQNVFSPQPWHALWDTGRTLLNRSVAADYPGTFAIRRETFQRMGGYDGNVLFENLELMRTVRAFGGRVIRPRDIYVVRRPPSSRRFFNQRVRQAYDDLAQPWRLTAYLPILPLALSRRGRRAVGGALAAATALAEVGRRRDGGTAVFPAAASLFAPLWVLERSVCVWLALSQRILLGGVRYGGRRVAVAAHSPRTLRRRLNDSFVSPRGRKTDSGMRPVAEGLAGRAAAPTQGDCASAGVDLVALGVGDAERPTHEEGSVLMRGNHGVIPRLLVGHAGNRAPTTAGGNGSRR